VRGDVFCPRCPSGDGAAGIVGPAVEVDLTPQADGSTLVRLIHRGFDDRAADAHQGDWVHYLDRFGRAAEGERVGPDTWADRRVPARAELER
jgi:hypothetical protein